MRRVMEDFGGVGVLPAQFMYGNSDGLGVTVHRVVSEIPKPGKKRPQDLLKASLSSLFLSLVGGWHM